MDIVEDVLNAHLSFAERQMQFLIEGKMAFTEDFQDLDWIVTDEQVLTARIASLNAALEAHRAKVDDDAKT